MPRRLANSLLAVALAALLFALPALAVAGVPNAPTTIAIEEDTNNDIALRDLLETGDMLVLASYNLAYATFPVDNVDVNFLAQLKNGATVLKTSTPYPYNDGGYGKGVISTYLTAAEVTAASLGAWPFAGLTLTLQGNPTIFTTVPTTTHTLAAGNYTTGSGFDTNSAFLQAQVLAKAAALQSSWTLVLLTDTGRLDVANGAPYFTLSVPNLRIMAPDAFSVATEAPNFPTPVPTPGGAGTLAQQSEDRFDSTFWLTPAFDSTGTTLGLPNGAFGGFLVLILIVVLTVVGLRSAGPTGGLIGFAMGVTIVLPVVGFYGGFIPGAWALLSIALVAMAAVGKMAREYFA